MAEIIDFPQTVRLSEHWRRAFQDFDIPSHTQGALVRYVDQRKSPGSFLRAVLSNQLFEAVTLADEPNQRALPDICKFIYNHVPSAAWGDAACVLDWIHGREL